MQIQTAIHDNSKGPVTVVPRAIWQRRDLALIVTGALACLRGVYNTARREGKEHQFFPCLLTPADFQSGAWKEKLEQTVRETVEASHPGGIVVYGSCLDFIYRAPMEAAAREWEETYRVPVRIFRRGALVSPVYPPLPRIPKVMESIPGTTAEIRPDGRDKTIPQSDFVGAAEVLQRYDTYNLLLDGGGCTECFSLPADRISTYKLKKTRFDSVEEAGRYKELLPRAIAADYKAHGEGKRLCLLASIIPTTLGFDIPWLVKELEKRGIPALYIPVDGLGTEEEGRRLAERALAGVL